MIPPGSNLSGYKIVLAPGLTHMDADLKAALRASGAQVLIGPRSGSKSDEFRTPDEIPAMPGLDLGVLRVESIRPDAPVPLQGGGALKGWREFVRTGADVVVRDCDGWPALTTDGTLHYLSGWPDDAAADRIISDLGARAGVKTMTLPDGLRCRDAGSWRFWFNFSATTQTIGYLTLQPAGVRWQPLD